MAGGDSLSLRIAEDKRSMSLPVKDEMRSGKKLGLELGGAAMIA